MSDGLLTADSKGFCPHKSKIDIRLTVPLLFSLLSPFLFHFSTLSFLSFIPLVLQYFSLSLFSFFPLFVPFIFVPFFLPIVGAPNLSSSYGACGERSRPRNSLWYHYFS